MSIETQSAEFDALDNLAKVYRETIQSVAIVDDGYPEARHQFEGALQSFFEAAERNGRFAPTSRFGMRLPSVALLRDCMEKFRFYQGQHEQKGDQLEQELERENRTVEARGINAKLRDTRDKAEVNKAIANRIERFLKNES